MQASHELEVFGYRVTLTPLLGLHATERALRIDQANDGSVELLGLAHEASRLAVAFGLGGNQSCA